MIVNKPTLYFILSVDDGVIHSAFVFVNIDEGC